MFWASGGVDERGFARPARVETTICPARALEEDGWDALETVQWWMASCTWDAWSGAPAGPPQWPLPGGELMQYSKLADAVNLLRCEWAHVKGGRK